MFSKIIHAGTLLAVSALLLAPFLLQEAQAETFVITSETTDYPTLVERGDVLIIEEGAQAELFIENNGTVINRGAVYGAITNHGSGLISNEEGGVFSALVDNHGMFENRGEYASPQRSTFHNHETGWVITYGYFDSHSMNFVNEGNLFVMPGGTFIISNGVVFDNTGWVINAGKFHVSKTTDFNNVSSFLYNIGEFFVGGYGTGSGSVFTNDKDSVVYNIGEMTNHDTSLNKGMFENYGILSNRPVGLISPLFNNTGVLNNNEGATLHNLDDSEMVQEGSIDVTIRNFGTINNSALIVNEGNGADIINECDATFNSEGTVEGNSVIEACPSDQAEG